MKEKRQLVWLSAEFPDAASTASLLPQWQLIPVAIRAEPPRDAIPARQSRVGVFDLSFLSNEQLAMAGSWLEALRVEHWVAILAPGQLDIPRACGLINAYCGDYHTRPIQFDRLHGILGHLWGMSQLQERAFRDKPPDYYNFALEGESPAITRARELLRKFAHTEEPVLIYGENGTGKEAAAAFIHRNSPRKRKPLVAVNCAALPPSLTQNELFGHEKGAFTHALKAHKGKIEMADGGTLLLAGVDELALEQQSAILRYLQEGHIERIGSCHPIRVDARLIATSTTPLDQLVASGRFRSDVFFRLGSLHVLLPPLRERKEDIVPLAGRILAAGTSTAESLRLADATTICLAQHPWPGNLRELQNRLRQALLLGEGAVIKPGDLGFEETPGVGDCRCGDCQSQQLSLDAFRSQADRRAISVSLALAQNNISAAARLLNISRVSLYRLMDKHQVTHKTAFPPSKRD